MYLGIDLGTSGVKSIIIDEAQNLVAEAASEPLAVIRARPGWSEQEPEAWLRAVCDTLDALKAEQPAALAAVRGIGLSGQMYSATVLDDQDKPLRPAILWNDTRSSAECDELVRLVPDLQKLTGRRPTPGVTAPKLLWLRKHEPALLDRIRSVLLPKDYVRLFLSGDKATDLADASGTMWVDLTRRAWSDRLLEATGLNRRQMPALFEGIEVTGRIRPDLAGRWGMQQRPVIAAGGGDNACGACGAGVINEGMGTISLGTSGVLFVANERPRDAGAMDIESLCHAVPGRWHQMSVILSATSCLTWLAGRLKQSPAELAGALGDAARPATDLIFIPYLDGAWSPVNDAGLRGGFWGLTHLHDDQAMTQAVMQGVGFAFLSCANAFRAGGARFQRLMAIGGGSRSRAWLSMLATSLDVALDLPQSNALGAAFGAARLGMIAAEDADPAATLSTPKIRATVAAEPSFADSYAEQFARWETCARLCQGAQGAARSGN